MTHTIRHKTALDDNWISCLGVHPIVCGLARLHHESVYYASLLPGSAACGMGSLGGMMMMIVLGGPAFGLIGAIVGSIASRFDW